MFGPVTSATRSASVKRASLGMNARAASSARSPDGGSRGAPGRIPRAPRAARSARLTARSASAVHTSSRASTRAVRWTRAIAWPTGRPERAEQLRLARRHPLLGAEHAGLVVLELGRHVPLGGGQRLPPLVVGGHPGRVRVGDLEVVAEHLVEADLERRDPGALALPLLERGDVLPAAVAQRAELVELGVVALRGSRRRRRAAPAAAPRAPPASSAARSASRSSSSTASARAAARPPRGQRRGGERARAPRHIGQPEERVAQRAELARGGASRRGAAGQPLDVPHAVERLAQPAPGRGRPAPPPRPRRAGSRWPPDRGAARAATAGAAGRPSASRWRRSSPAGCSRGPRRGAARPARGSAGSSRRARGTRRSGARTAARGAAARTAAARSGSAAARRRRRAPARPPGPTPRPSSEASANRRASSSRREVGIELPALAHRAEDAVAGGAAASSGHDHFRRRRVGRAPRPSRRLVQGLEQELAGAEVDRREARSRSSAARRPPPGSCSCPPASQPSCSMRARRDGLHHLAAHQALGRASGSSTCSQMATRCPAPTSCRRYSAAAFTGTPASGTPSPREVRVISRTRAASSASSWNIS